MNGERKFIREGGNSAGLANIWCILYLREFIRIFFVKWSSLLWGGKNAYIRGKKKLISKKNRMKERKKILRKNSKNACDTIRMCCFGLRSGFFVS